uniref:VMP136 protein n=1 Tax=Bicyclus anynana TaxID=110368 RepID=A0A1C9EGL5_BICAN|nr:VMP136 protein [Bicyclus anynana]
MKITILLCAVTAIAVAVPTHHHENLQEESTLENLPTTIQREKKSPLHDHHAAEMTHEAGSEDILASKSGHRVPMEGRSLGFKKPIIVKKKIGYHVYRDSDEEMAHADPHENCSKQIKVKLCDEESGLHKNMGACLTSKRLNEEITEKEIENSIKKAKEAVENLQRGLHRMEHSSAKLANTEDKELDDDLEVHQHIEAARKALEHVQKNFGNLDTLGLQAPTIEELQEKSTDEERLAQWKEAIDNIHKNFEIARNIEDAFKTDSEQTNLKATHTSYSSKIRESEHKELDIEPHHKSNTASLSNVELQPEGLDAFKKQRENDDMDSDMFTAPTEHKESKIKLHSDSLKTENKLEESLKNHETETRNVEKLNVPTLTMKSAEILPLAGESLKIEDTKSENHKEIPDHVHQQQSKAVKEEENSERKKLKTSEGITHDMDLKTEKNAVLGIHEMTPLSLAKSAHIESLDKSTKHHEHDMSVEASDISSNQSHLEMKHSTNTEIEKSTHKDDFTVAILDHSLKSKSVNDVDELHKNMGRMSHGIPEMTNEKETGTPHHTHMNDFNANIAQDKLRNSEGKTLNGQHIFSEASHHMRSEDENASKFTPTKGFDNEQHSMNPHSIMRMIEDQNEEHTANEMHNLHNLNDHTGMRMTEDQNKINSFLMRWAHENQQRLQESPLSLEEQLATISKLGEFHNGQNEHSNMRMNLDHNAGHHFSDNHEQESKQWAQENQDQKFRDMFSMRLAQEKQQNDHLKTMPEFHNGHMHDAQNRFPQNLVNTHDLSQLGPIMHERLHAMKNVMASDMDSAMQPSMHMSMRDSIGKPVHDRHDMHWNHHHHATARYGAGLPITAASPGAVGLFPNANTGGCGIPLMLSCSPNVVSGTLAKAQPHPGSVSAPAYRSDDNLMYYMKRDAKNTDDLPTIKIQKSTLPFNHKSELIFDKTQ